jgi:hypothetical protein
LWVTLEFPSRCGRTFGVEDGREARWRLAPPLIFHRHLFAELAVVSLERLVRGSRNWDFVVFADGVSARVHVVVDLSLEVLVEGHVVERCDALMALYADGQTAGTAAFEAGHGFAGRGLLYAKVRLVDYAVLLAVLLLSKGDFSRAQESECLSTGGHWWCCA